MHQHQQLVAAALDWMNGAQGVVPDVWGYSKSHHDTPVPPPSTEDGTETSPESSEPGNMALSWLSVGLSSLCLLMGVAISIHLSLGLHSQLLVSALRAVLQLTFLGVVLVPLFTYSRWWMVLLYSIFMTCVAALEAGQRPAYSYQGQYLHTLLSLTMGAWSLIVYTVVAVVRPHPMYDAQYVIPILGMLLGSATSGVAVGLNTALQDLASSKEYIELLLSLGANRTEATKTVVQKALTNAMMPTINMMAVMGLVSIPGMMTGQILAGADPSDASRYQMMIVFLISGSTGIAATAAVHMAVWHIVDEGSHYRPDRLLPRKSAVDTWKDAGRRVLMALARTKALCLTCLCCVTPTSFHKRPQPVSRYEMMYNLDDDEILDEEEGLTGRGGNTSHHALMPYSTPPRPASNGTYHHMSSAGVGSPGSHASTAASTLTSPGSMLQGGAGHMNGVGSLAPGVWSSPQLAGGGWGGGGGGASGASMGMPLQGESGGVMQAKGGGMSAPQGPVPHQMQAPPTMVLGADMPPSQQGPQTRSRRIYNFGVRIAHAAMDRLGNTSSGRGGPQYVPLSTGAGTNSNVCELGEEDGSNRGGGAGQSGPQSQSNTVGFGSHQQGPEEGAGGSPESEQHLHAQQAQPENEWGEVGMASPHSGSSTPGDGLGSPAVEFYDAQSVGGSQMGSRTASRRNSFSSMRGLGSRVLSPDPHQQLQTQQPSGSSGRATPPQT